MIGFMPELYDDELLYSSGIKPIIQSPFRLSLVKNHCHLNT